MEAPPRIGICLSGGGFRASFYALGVFRYLAEAGLLGDVVAVSAVSGGSLAAAASAAVPAFFPPASLPTAGLGLRNAPAVLSLADGGVYDNLGLEWFQGWSSGRPTSAEPADFLIVANAGGLLTRTSHPYGG